MNETPKGFISLEVISIGRDVGEVLSSYMRYHKDATKIASEEPGKGPDQIFAEAMKGAIYRLYLLGVEDGMKGVKQ